MHADSDLPSPARKNLPHPPAPAPLERPLGTFGLLRALWHNPLEAWTQAHFEEQLTLHDYRLGRIAVVSAPSGIRRVLLDNAQNYRKNDLQRRVIGAALHKGLLIAEDDDWHMQRRVEIDPHHVVWPLQRVTLRLRGALPMRIQCHNRAKRSL